MVVIYLIFFFSFVSFINCQPTQGPLAVFYGQITYQTRDTDNVIRILFPAQLAGGPPLMPAICMCLRIWEDKVNSRGGIRINGTVWTVTVIMVDVSAIGAASVAQVNARIRNCTGECIKPYPYGAYGRIDFMLCPYSSTFSAACLQVADPAKMIVISGTYLYSFPFYFSDSNIFRNYWND